MKGARLQRYAGPDGVEVVDLPAPRPAAGEAVIAVTHCGLNRADLALTEGAYGGVPRDASVFGDGNGLPHPLGIEPVGRVVATGAGVDPALTGRRVSVVSHFGCGACTACLDGHDELCPAMRVLGTQTPDRGGLDERLAVPATHLVPLPDAVPSELAACVSVGYVTAWWIVGALAGLYAGQTVAVKGASGPVGLAALDLARARGAHAIAITRDAGKRAALLEAGAAEVLVADPTETAREAADVVVEPFGGASWTDSLRLARRGGTIALVGAHHASRAPTDLSLLFAKGLRVVGSARAPLDEDARVIALIAAGTLRPRVARRFPLSRVREALAAHAAGVGKVVVEVDGG